MILIKILLTMIIMKKKEFENMCYQNIDNDTLYFVTSLKDNEISQMN